MNRISRLPFRAEALRNATAAPVDGDLLQISPTWTRWAYWILVAAIAWGLLYAAFGTVYEYGSGPAVVWSRDRDYVTATVSGTVEAIDVMPGQRVETGHILVRFYAAREQAELDRLQREFELQLARTLRDPSDQTAHNALTGLRTQRDLASSRVAQLVVTAPHAGVIGDIRIHRGQLIEQGDVVLGLLGKDAGGTILAMLPAQHRPRLQPGMSLRFEVTGYRYAYQEMIITSVGAQIIGPSEVKRYLGQEIGDTVQVEGPVVLIEATSPSPTFVVDGEIFNFYHGMNGTAEARLRSESILVALIPGLRILFEKIHG
jgi:multidrug efflux pump subunit AcrA (membrane-fusion protein)